MSKRLTTADFIKRSKSIHENTYTYDTTVYIDARTKVEITCPIHGKFWQLPFNHMNNHGCTKCMAEQNSERLFDSKDSFIKKARKIHGAKYDYTQVEYQSSQKKVHIICPIHDGFWQIPGHHLNQHEGCPECKNDVLRELKADTLESFIAKARKQHGDKYNYGTVIYKDSLTPVTILCPTHGKFQQVPAGHLSGRGCTLCGYKMRREKLAYTTEEFVIRAKHLFDNKYDYSRVIYKNNSTPIIINCKEHGDFIQTPYEHLTGHIACKKCNVGISKAENELFDFIKLLAPDAIQGSYKIIPPKQLDIYIPSMKIGIEYNGQFWHSETQLNTSGRNGKKYHLEKFLLCKEKEIKLIQIFEAEWLYKQSQVKARLNSLLGHNQKIFARNTEVKQISAQDSNIFLNFYHLQGSGKSSWRFGLYHDGTLVSVMTFCIPRFSKKSDIEMSRYATKEGITIVGGAAKLFTTFIKEMKPNYVVSYADLRWGTGNFYEKLGFKLCHYSAPNYFYYKMDDFKLKSRNQFQKHKLKYKLEVFDENKTEIENMAANGYERIFDAGNAVYEWHSQPIST